MVSELQQNTTNVVLPLLLLLSLSLTKSDDRGAPTTTTTSYLSFLLSYFSSLPPLSLSTIISLTTFEEILPWRFHLCFDAISALIYYNSYYYVALESTQVWTKFLVLRWSSIKVNEALLLSLLSWLWWLLHFFFCLIFLLLVSFFMVFKLLFEFVHCQFHFCGYFLMIFAFTDDEQNTTLYLAIEETTVNFQDLSK